MIWVSMSSKQDYHHTGPTALWLHQICFWEISQMWHKPNLAVKGISIFFEVWRSSTQVRYLTAWISQFSPCATTRWTLTSDQRPVLRFSITELLVCGRLFLPEEGSCGVNEMLNVVKSLLHLRWMQRLQSLIDLGVRVSIKIRLFLMCT